MPAKTSYESSTPRRLHNRVKSDDHGTRRSPGQNHRRTRPDRLGHQRRTHRGLDRTRRPTRSTTQPVPADQTLLGHPGHSELTNRIKSGSLKRRMRVRIRTWRPRVDAERVDQYPALRTVGATQPDGMGHVSEGRLIGIGASGHPRQRRRQTHEMNACALSRKACQAGKTEIQYGVGPKGVPLKRAAGFRRYLATSETAVP